MTNGLKYVLDSLKRSADNSECWPVYPSESGLILAEIDRLRKENEELKHRLGEHRREEEG